MLQKTEGDGVVETGTMQVLFQCPGCNSVHGVLVGGTYQGPKWQWNGSVDMPTLQPSLLVRDGCGGVCHSFVTDGRIQFLADCSHALANQTVDLPPPPDWLL